MYFGRKPAIEAKCRKTPSRAQGKLSLEVISPPRWYLGSRRFFNTPNSSNHILLSLIIYTVHLEKFCPGPRYSFQLRNLKPDTVTSNPMQHLHIMLRCLVWAQQPFTVEGVRKRDYDCKIALTLNGVWEKAGLEPQGTRARKKPARGQGLATTTQVFVRP